MAGKLDEFDAPVAMTVSYCQRLAPDAGQLREFTQQYTKAALLDLVAALDRDPSLYMPPASTAAPSKSSKQHMPSHSGGRAGQSHGSATTARRAGDRDQAVSLAMHETAAADASVATAASPLVHACAMLIQPAISQIRRLLCCLGLITSSPSSISDCEVYDVSHALDSEQTVALDKLKRDIFKAYAYAFPESNILVDQDGIIGLVESHSHMPSIHALPPPPPPPPPMALPPTAVGSLSLLRPSSVPEAAPRTGKFVHGSSAFLSASLINGGAYLAKHTQVTAQVMNPAAIVNRREMLQQSSPPSIAARLGSTRKPLRQVVTPQQQQQQPGARPKNNLMAELAHPSIQKRLRKVNPGSVSRNKSRVQHSNSNSPSRRRTRATPTRDLSEALFATVLQHKFRNARSPSVAGSAPASPWS
ncbi:hypothetical protein CAOG_06398 [Capsaspora owczarzaki ATCC 30864]|uniref:Uncharacterized protein n=1 Tax=Capsaspora owczarzaki (strain ATCC 30864) TaxID=595528 RepID=A0A0D2X4G6_CAPO3|nr:hypothetical protein CAOG_06398 [Capsaspora owczarzaki ATCC 30864]KJE96024.1 hypothetical protein CAOG_006398 [Capsaspora owczarzaki ATCC 30864]|eukprot:XP_004345147.1 hypothetical protein CAOG_06398 [Capsaspora owczarzaki ATCC 30864]